MEWWNYKLLPREGGEIIDQLSAYPGVVWPAQGIAWWLLPWWQPRHSSLLCSPAPVPCCWPVLCFVWIGRASLCLLRPWNPDILSYLRAPGRAANLTYMQTASFFYISGERAGGYVRLKDIKFVMITMIIVCFSGKSNKLRIRKPDLIAATSQWHIPSHSLLGCRPIALARWTLSCDL